MATRRLPVIQEPTGEDAEAAARPPWQWVLVGSGLLVTIWTPSVAIVLAVARKIAASTAGAAPGPGLAAGLVGLTFALAALATGYLVSRFGPRTRRRHAVLAGVLATTEIWLIAMFGGAFTTPLVAASAFFSLAALAAGFCALGSLIARRKKRPA